MDKRQAFQFTRTEQSRLGLEEGQWQEVRLLLVVQDGGEEIGEDYGHIVGVLCNH